MLKRLVFIYIFGIAALHAMEPEARFQIDTQAKLNQSCARISIEVYENINKNVRFSEDSNTDSQFWETETLLTKKYFKKKRGVPLSTALDDLINGNSNTAFECTTAQCINIWKMLMPFQMDRIIEQLEERNADFFLPLVTTGVLASHHQYTWYYGFSRRDEAFKIGSIPVNTKEEWIKFTKLSAWMDKLPVYSAFKSLPNNVQRPYNTCLGGSIYLPSAEGIKGAAKGENLICVNATGLFYGFGVVFKDGPKRMYDIAMSLEQAGLSQNKELYVDGCDKRLKELGIQVPNGRHQLQYFIDSDTCLYLSLKELKTQLKIMDLD